MRAVIQRVSQASITISGKEKCSIGQGLLILLGIEEGDTLQDIYWLTAKIGNLRIFNDSNEVMNFSVKEIDGEVMVVSQFTLHASTRKGNRPSYIRSAKPGIAIPLYETFIEEMEKELGKPLKTGEFGADMKVALVNDGPVTIIIDSKNRE